MSNVIRRTISIKLITNTEQSRALTRLQKEYNIACTEIASIAYAKQCYNKVALHHLVYYELRRNTKLGAQMVCNAIRAVSDAIYSLKRAKKKVVTNIIFRPTSSVHFDKRTYTIKEDIISLNTLSKRIKVSTHLGEFQREYLKRGTSKEAELIYKKGCWYFNLVLDFLETPMLPSNGMVLGIDTGVNNLVATSSGKLIGGDKLIHDRNKFLALRRRLQSNGTKSSRQLLKKISGKEARRIRHVNHVASKDVVKEAIAHGCNTIGMEELTNIRSRIKAGKRMRSRLHGWAFAQLQGFIEYKAHEKGLRTVYVNPAYTSKTCAICGSIGVRSKHRFRCKLCGIQRHSDLNASQNIRRIAISADVATGAVNCPYV
ncbi:MAG: RNA-guided endonuclease InsQ/TnpB family protein [Candidatus Babeliales bacterium]